MPRKSKGAATPAPVIENTENLVSPLRHLAHFSPTEFGDTPVHIIGCGATGSRIALEVAKLGVRVIHLWDFDKVEAHNVANQIFGLNHVGMSKVDALSQIIKEQTGLKVCAHNEKVTGEQELEGFVFLLTDTMSSRKEIWDKALKYKVRVLRMVETRMGANEGRIYSINSCSAQDVEFWEKQWYPDTAAETSVCGSEVTVGGTAAVVSGLATWALIEWNKQYHGREATVQKEVLFYLCPPTFVNQ